MFLVIVFEMQESQNQKELIFTSKYYLFCMYIVPALIDLEITTCVLPVFAMCFVVFFGLFFNCLYPFIYIYIYLRMRRELSEVIYHNT